MRRFLRWLWDAAPYASPDTAAAVMMLNDTKGQ